MNENLPELRDIHIPDGVSSFPPAYGWYVILVAAIAVFVLFRLYQNWRLRSRRLYALRLLSTLDTNDMVGSAVKISELLRRICVFRYPEAVSLSGKAWIDFLQAHGQTKLPAASSELLLNAPYMKPGNSRYDRGHLQGLITFARAWIGENL